MTLFEILSLFLGAGILLGAVRLIFMTGKTSEKIDRLCLDLAEMKVEMKSGFEKCETRSIKIEDKLQILDSKISRIDGQLSGPSYFEPKVHSNGNS